jgi:hypothetical protein
MLNKKGAENVIMGAVIFILLNILFLSILAFYITRSGNTASIYEETYAKQIALFIDGAKPGTRIELDVSELFAIGRDNSFETIIELDCDENRVTTQLTRNGKYAFEYFSDLKKCDFQLDKINEKFIINV